MKYWYDTEFIEDGKTIDLISIGIVAEDGREFYAISTEFNAKKANQWVKDNVLSKLPPKNWNEQTSPRLRDEAIAHYRTRDKIKKEMLAFIGNDIPDFWAYYADYDHVVLCQLFGTMMDLPKGWPMYTNDIKQLCNSLGNPKLPEQGKDEHNALCDAKWCKEAYDFLLSIAK